MLREILKFLRFVNKKTLDIQVFLIPTHIRAKIQVILFCILPRYVSLLSIKTAKLPRLDQRFDLNSNNLNEFIVLNKRNFKEKEVNLFIRSKKNNYEYLKQRKLLNLKKKIFLLNPLYIKNETQKRISHYKEMKLLIHKNKNFIYVTADWQVVESFIKNNLNVLYIQDWQNNGKNFFLQKWEKPIYKRILKYCKKRKNSFVVDVSYNTTCTHYTSSAIAAASFFAKVCEKVNIHNWNFYMSKNPKKYSFFKTVNLLYPLKFRLKNNVFLETSLWHWYFIYKLLKLNNVSIDGHLTGVVKNNRVIHRLERIFCK